MRLDPETDDIESSRPIPQDFDGPIEHPGVSTLRDDEFKNEKTSDETSIHSQSTNVVEPAPDGSEALSDALSIVPRSRRRGLLGRFACIIPEVERPYEYKNSTKWFITFIIALAAAAAPMGTAIFLPALPQLATDLNTTPTITNLSIAMYMLAMSIFPLWWSSFSETLGRRTIYLVSFALFTLWNIVSAISTSIGMLIIMRVLGGGAAASVQAVGAGTIADIWEVRERGRAMGIFYLGPLLGPLLAPIIGGALAQAWGWRSTQWFQVIYGGLLFITLTFCLPETLDVRRLPLKALAATPPTDEKSRGTLTRTSTRQSIHLKTKRVAKIFKRCIIDPLSVLAYLRFPAVLITVYLASIAFGSLYVLNISIQQTFSEPPYGFSVIILGLLYIPNSLGYLLGSVLGGRWTDHIMHREAKAAGRFDEAGKLIFIPEDRMGENVWLAALMPRKSSSGVAVNNFVRNIFSCVGGIVASPIINAIGDGWVFTILAIVCWISSFAVVWAMRRFGPQWRVSMEARLR
ncbi:MFS transporter [Lachnellula subtilissima]|uniref:MFS transporter n=1 Tax=Lachnellula subtilissima TaxID=602034 RepID=A0A8H8RCG4_9HELO|nr:MFS transporter [Lachnellula subtilissima]